VNNLNNNCPEFGKNIIETNELREPTEELLKKVILDTQKGYLNDAN
jgi:hypothetical protein